MFAPKAATALTNMRLAKDGLVYNADLPALANQIIAGNMENADTVSAIAAGMGKTGVDLVQFSHDYIDSLSVAYNLGFGVACISLIASILIYFACRSWFKHADVTAKQAAAANPESSGLTAKQTKDRIVALVLVFAVVIFFWMAFHQNGSSLTYFARDYTDTSVSGLPRIGFNIWALALIAISVYTLFATFQSETARSKSISGAVTIALWGSAYLLYNNMEATVSILPQEFQQFNPFFVVALTPVSMAIFGALAKRGKEPSAPKKIGLGMLEIGRASCRERV